LNGKWEVLTTAFRLKAGRLAKDEMPTRTQRFLRAGFLLAHEGPAIQGALRPGFWFCSTPLRYNCTGFRFVSEVPDEYWSAL